jgi:protoporphyrinogen oxidase
MGCKTAIIAGAGPAGLTAAYELLDKTDIKPVVYEMSCDIGGISKTVVHNGNRMDIGGHRFFSKSDRVMEWWQNILPLQGAPARDDLILGRTPELATECLQRELASSLVKKIIPPDPEKQDGVMLLRSRLSRIFFLQTFFDYPVTLSPKLLFGLGLVRVTKIGMSYIASKVAPRNPELSLEDFFINRFGKELYNTFFKDYTEKVWGIPCSKIKPEWGAQRIKGLSVTKALLHAVKALVKPDSSVAQKDVETSLINQFMYPKFGPGQMWEEVASQVASHGGEVHLNHEVIGLTNEDDRIVEVHVRNEADGSVTTVPCDYFFSTMPVKQLVESFRNPVPEPVRQVASGLMYRDFLTVGLLINKLKIRNETNIRTINGIVPDNWIYVQEKNVKLGRIQVFNNWSPYLVADSGKVWLGLEYFCYEGDDIWSKSDSDMIAFAADELASINIIDRNDVLDGTVIRMPKTYPTYSGTYEQFDVIKDYVSSFRNLFLIGRNGMHKYNNADHSMLTAMTAVENISEGINDKENIWSVNTEEEYHEETS